MNLEYLQLSFFLSFNKVPEVAIITIIIRVNFRHKSYQQHDHHRHHPSLNTPPEPRSLLRIRGLDHI